MRRVEDFNAAVLPMVGAAAPSSSSSSSATASLWLPWRHGTRVNVNLALSTVVILLVVVFTDLIVLPILTTNAAAQSPQHRYYPQGFIEYEDASSNAAMQDAVMTMRRSPAIDMNDSTTCHYGGVRTSQGCVCGRGTAGEYCEVLTVPPDELNNVTVCGTECWAAYVWYPTVHFQFRPIKEEEERIWEKARTVMAWKNGGELRRPAAMTAMGKDVVTVEQPIDPVVLNWMVSLGPWTPADRQILSVLHEFQREIPRLRRGYEARLADASSVMPREKARLCFGLIVHKDPWQFEAFWNVMYRRHHHYIIHIDSQSAPEIRAAITATIDATDFDGEGSVWDRVELIPLEQSVAAFWGDITLVYLEVLMWLRAFLRMGQDWEWDYFINMSIADIPIVPLDDIEGFLGRSVPTNYMSWHPNTEEFRQVHFVPERDRLREVTVLSPLQAEMPSGRWRMKHGQTRLYGCTQWHMWHWTLTFEFATNPLIHGLLFSLKDTGIPDECFFATAAVWLSETTKERNSPIPQLPIQGGDYKYRNEGTNRNLDAPGELEHLKSQSRMKVNLWARKAYTAHTTCRFTNALLGLDHDCQRYEGKVPPEEAQ